MNVTLQLDLLLYGVMLATLGSLAHRLVPALGLAIVITGIVGGGLAAFLGILGLWGMRTHYWPIGTLILVDIALMLHSAEVWLSVKRGAEELKPAALILTMLVVFGIGQLVNFLHWRSREK